MTVARVSTCVLRRFESRWVTVAIKEGSPAIMLKGMGGSRVGVWCAHGEGRAKFPAVAVQQDVLSQGLAPVRSVQYCAYRKASCMDWSTCICVHKTQLSSVCIVRASCVHSSLRVSRSIQLAYEEFHTLQGCRFLIHTVRRVSDLT